MVFPVSLQTMVTPLTQKYFGYGELENSIMYCLCGVEVIAGFLFVRWLSRRVAERVVLAIGLTICNISGVWCLIFLANPMGQSALKNILTFVIFASRFVYCATGTATKSPISQ